MSLFSNEHSSTLTIDGDEYGIDQFCVGSVRYEAGEFTVGCLIHGEFHSRLVPDIIIHKDSQHDFGPSDETHISISAGFEGRYLPGVDDTQTIRPIRYEDFDTFLSIRNEHGGGVGGVIKVPRSLSEVLNAYGEAKDGFAGRATGSFWRMVYLSTVTITTVGYGDIVPITTVTRTLIATEAVLGMLIIGLYLNALSHRLRPTSG